MHIQGPTHVHSAQPINAPHRLQQPSQAAARPAAQADQLDISREAELVSRVREMPSIRANKVAELRAQIAAGDYETADKLDVALDRMLEEMVGGYYSK